jgi:hypothetical protein
MAGIEEIGQKTAMTRIEVTRMEIEKYEYKLEITEIELTGIDLQEHREYRVGKWIRQ